MRIVIAAAGDSPPWEMHTGVRKHLVNVEGEILLHRTVRQCLEYSDDVWVSGNPDPEYKIPGAKLIVGDRREGIGSVDFMWRDRELWSQTGRTVLLLGDVWYSDDAMRTILADTRRDWMYYARYGASTVYGCDCGEGWAHAMYPEHIELHLRALGRVIGEYLAGSLNRTLGWEVYRAMCGQDDLSQHGEWGNWTEINDWTTDFDYPVDYDRWTAARKDNGHTTRNTA